MEPDSITIALSGESQGNAISPANVPLATLAEFAADVDAFIKGASKEVDTRGLGVSVVPGSLAITSQPLLAPSLFRDLKSLKRSADLSAIDSKRSAIVAKWQAAARSALGWSVKLVSGSLQGAILIDKTTDFKALNADVWLEVERYIHGELTDLGGSTKANAHIKLPDGKKLIVRASRDLISSETDNRVYHTVHVRIKAKYNLVTGELKDPTLIEFVDYAPKFDETQFEQFTRNGAKAWGDVESSSEWVRQIRGADE